METLVHLLLALVALPPALACLYILLLTLPSARLPRPRPAQRTLRFDIIVPAHDEAAVIERVVASLSRLDWPREQFRILVVADNCSDDTGARAAAAGATVLTRHDASLRGKGYALQFGMARSAADGYADAVVVVDADTGVSPNLLEAFAARIEQGAQAMQANYGVLNPDDSWRTRIITIAYGAFHAVRSRSRERMGVSCGLRGNGMGFTRELLERHPFRIFSMTEDLEYGIVLGLAGVRIHYVDEAAADAELLVGGAGADSQRQRWEGGRMAVARAYIGKLLAQAARKRSAVCLELACDLLTLPLGYIAMQVVAAGVLAALASFWFASALPWLWLALAMFAVLLLHVLRGWQLCPLGLRGLLALVQAPFFVAWKLYALLRNRGNKTWVKTRRNDP